MIANCYKSWKLFKCGSLGKTEEEEEEEYHYDDGDDEGEEDDEEEETRSEGNLQPSQESDCV